MGRAQRNCGLRIADCGLFNPKSAFRNPQCRRGQSTLEYILVITAILIAVGLATRGAGGKYDGVVPNAVTKSMTDSSGVIEKASGKLKGGLGL